MAQTEVTDWQSRKTFPECNRYMLENEICCHVSFLVGEERKRMSAHKYILISRSSVFQVMFCGPLAEQGNEIVIPDVPQEAFINVLRYIYCEETLLTPYLVLSVLYAARKYAIGGLEDEIITWLNENITLESVCTIVNQAVMYKEESLQDKCLQYIDIHAEAVLSSDGFRDLTRDNLAKVLMRDSLHVKEEKVFEATCGWSNADCTRRGLIADGESQRQVLGDVIYLVRFPLMDGQYFACQVVDQHLLTYEECTRILQSLIAGPKTLSKFSSKPRSALTQGQIIKVLRFSTYDSTWSYSNGLPDVITFSCDKTILLHGISLYGSKDGVASYNVDLSIECESTDREVRRTSVVVETNRGIFPVMLSEVLSVQAGLRMTIKAVISGPRSFRGRLGRSSIQMNGCVFTFSSPDGPRTNGTNVLQGQIPELVFSMEGYYDSWPNSTPAVWVTLNLRTG